MTYVIENKLKMTTGNRFSLWGKYRTVLRTNYTTKNPEESPGLISISPK
jgi:hypothetical protein